MPVYQYKCSSGHTFTKLRRIRERTDPLSCEECGEPAEHALTGCAIITGSGVRTPARQAEPRGLNGIDTSTLPVVGRDGKLYSADGTTVLKE